MINKLMAILSIVALFIGCSSNPQSDHENCAEPKGNQPIITNGDSELALLMRDMFEESDSLRHLIIKGEQLSVLKKYQGMHSAIPTDSRTKGAVYEAFTKTYIASIKAFETADSSSVFKFNNMVDQCMNCHTEFCPGPKKRIKKLYISN